MFIKIKNQQFKEKYYNELKLLSFLLKISTFYRVHLLRKSFDVILFITFFIFNLSIL